MPFSRSTVAEVAAGLRSRHTVIQVVIGPRQVGKSTAAAEVEALLGWPTRSAAADDALPPGPEWTETHWQAARLLPGRRVLLVLDEIQKVVGWAERRLSRADPLLQQDAGPVARCGQHHHARRLPATARHGVSRVGARAVLRRPGPQAGQQPQVCALEQRAGFSAGEAAFFPGPGRRRLVGAARRERGRWVAFEQPVADGMGGRLLEEGQCGSGLRCQPGPRSCGDRGQIWPARQTRRDGYLLPDVSTGSAADHCGRGAAARGVFCVIARAVARSAMTHRALGYRLPRNRLSWSRRHSRRFFHATWVRYD